MAAFLLILPSGALQALDVEDEAALRTYARARAAGSIGGPTEAARGYAAALALSPDDATLAERALRQALIAGDRSLALGAARTLQRRAASTPESRLLLLTEAVRRSEWKEAEAMAAEFERDEVFGFMTPLLRAWIVFGSRKGDPLKVLAAGSANPLTASYAVEQRALLLLAKGDEPRGMAELSRAAMAAGPRGDRLRIAAAATLAKRGKRDNALALLQGDSAPLRSARRLVEARRPLPGAVEKASEGLAALLVRLAEDLRAQNAAGLGLTFARLATFLAPADSDAWLITSRLLNAERHPQEALAALRPIGPEDPFAQAAADARVQLLVQTGAKEMALTQAQAAAKLPGAGADDLARLGEIYGTLGRWQEAADAYTRAIDAAPAGDTSVPAWALWLLRGSAMDEAGRWPEAKAALEQAHKLAPTEPLVLNYLGYAQLERRENIVEAEKLVAEASRLQPDSPEITDSLGWAYFLRGDQAKAVELLERAARSEPDDPEINEHLGDAYYNVGRRYEARYAWRAALLYAEEKDAPRLRAKIDAGWTPELASP